MDLRFSIMNDTNVHIFINAPRDIYFSISAGYCLKKGILGSKYI